MLFNSSEKGSTVSDHLNIKIEDQLNNNLQFVCFTLTLFKVPSLNNIT